MPKAKTKKTSTEEENDCNTQNINVCVTCSMLTECEDVFILTFEDTYFINIFNICMGFKLSENSELKYICLDCIKTIISFHTFKETAIKSYEELNKNEAERVCTAEKDDLLDIDGNSNIDNNIDFLGNKDDIDENSEPDSNQCVIVQSDVKVELIEEEEVHLDNLEKTDGQDNNIWKCSYCPLTFSKNDPSEIKKHRYAEKVKRLRIFPCPVCKKMFTKSIINEHILRHGKQKPSICEICGKGVSSNQSLKQHMMLHDGKKYQCKICKKGYSQRFLLTEHMYLHEKEKKKFLCSTCGLSFPSPTNLRDHLYRHRKNNRQLKPENPDDDVREFTRHICDFCGKNFSSTKTLAVHRATHDSTELYECDRCGKKFAHRALLTSHIWLHMAEFRCLTCFKIYQKDDMKKHECIPLPEGEVFDGFLSNECRECGEILHIGHVERHMKSHEARECKFCGVKIIGARKFQFHVNGHKLRCDLCNKSFAKKNSFILHMKNRVCERSKISKKQPLNFLM